MEYKIIQNKVSVTFCVLHENHMRLLERKSQIKIRDNKTEISVRSNSTLHLKMPKFHCN